MEQYKFPRTTPSNQNLQFFFLFFFRNILLHNKKIYTSQDEETKLKKLLYNRGGKEQK